MLPMTSWSNNKDVMILSMHFGLMHIKKYAYIEYVLKIRVAIKKGYEREHLKGVKF